MPKLQVGEALARVEQGKIVPAVDGPQTPSSTRTVNGKHQTNGFSTDRRIRLAVILCGHYPGGNNSIAGCDLRGFSSWG